MATEMQLVFLCLVFRPVFLDVLVERRKGIAGNIIADINRMKEDEADYLTARNIHVDEHR